MGGTRLADQYPPQYPRNRQGSAPYQYPQGGQPQYPPYQQAPYGQAAPSNQYGYNAQGRGQPRQGRANVSNPWATRSLIYGILSIVLIIVGFFIGRIFIGLIGLYAIYYAIRGLSYANRLPGNQGIASSVIGLILSSLAVLATIGLLILSALPGN